MRRRSEKKKCGVDRRSVVAVFTRGRKACLFLFGSIIVRLGVQGSMSHFGNMYSTMCAVIRTRTLTFRNSSPIANCWIEKLTIASHTRLCDRARCPCLTLIIFAYIDLRHFDSRDIRCPKGHLFFRT